MWDIKHDCFIDEIKQATNTISSLMHVYVLPELHIHVFSSFNHKIYWIVERFSPILFLQITMVSLPDLDLVITA